MEQSVSNSAITAFNSTHIYSNKKKEKENYIFLRFTCTSLGCLIGKNVVVHDIFTFTLDQPKCFLLVNLDIHILHRKCKGSLTKGFCIFLTTFKFPREVQLYVYNNKQHKSCYRWMILKDVNVFTRNVIFSRKWIGVVQDNI